MEEDIQNHSPTVMFRGTPCIFRPFFSQFILLSLKKCVYYFYVRYNYVKFRIDFFNHKVHLAHADIIYNNNIIFSGIILTIVHSMALGYSAMIILIGTRPILFTNLVI